MKIVMLLLKTLLFAAFGFVTYFTFEPEQAIGIILLVALVIAQLWFLSGRIRPKSAAAPSPIDASRTAQVIQNLAVQSKAQRKQILNQAQRATKAAAQKAPVKQAKPAPKPQKADLPDAAGIDPSLFSKFQQSLDQTEPDEPLAVITEEDTAEVVVNLSKSVPKAKAEKQAPNTPEPVVPKPVSQAVKPKMRNPYAGSALAKPAAKKPAAPKPSIPTPPSKEAQDNHLLDQVPSEPLGDLFEHLDEGAGAKKKAATTITPKPRRPQQDTASGKSPLVANETLSLKGFDELGEPEQQISSLQLKSAEKALREKQYPQAAQIAEDWLRGEGKSSKNLKEALPFVDVATKAWWEQKDYPSHLKLWEFVFSSIVPKNSKEYLPLLEERIDEYVKINLEEQAVPFLLTALSVYKAQEDHLRMEGVYLSLEKAYGRLKDDKALAQCLNGHLGVKRALKDYPGQLELLDELGKRLYDQGDQQGSRQCYEESLVVKQQMQTTNP